MEMSMNGSKLKKKKSLEKRQETGNTTSILFR